MSFIEKGFHTKICSSAMSAAANKTIIFYSLAGISIRLNKESSCKSGTFCIALREPNAIWKLN